MTESAAPAPPIDHDVDLRDFPHTPIFRSRLFGSAFHARVSDAGWRAGVTLWLKSWDQVPAGSLPNDDIELCRLAEFGRDLKSWRKIKHEGLLGWTKCSDGRLYHRVVSEGVNAAWGSKLEQRWRTECARIKKAAQRSGRDLAVPDFNAWLSQRHVNYVPEDNIGTSSGTNPGRPKPVPREMPSKGREEKDKDPEAKASDEIVELPLVEIQPKPLKAAIFGECLVWLSGAANRPADKLRSHLGKLCQQFGDGAVLEVLIEAQKESPLDPSAWIEGALRSRNLRADRQRIREENIRRTSGAPL